MATEVMSAEILQLETVDELLAKRLLSRGLNRGAFCRRFDKGGLVRWHMAAAREYRRLEGENSLLPRIYHMVEKKRASEPLEALEKIDISGLDLRSVDCEGGKVHCGQALYGRFCVPAFKTANVHTVLEDSGGRAIPVLIQNAVAATDYPLGMEVAIRQPWVTTVTRPDTCTGILVDNPAHLVDLKAPIVPSDLERKAGFSEHIGPVAINIGKEVHNTGRRGLFATRDVRPGELVLVSKAMAAVEEKKGVEGPITWGLLIDNGSTNRAMPLMDRLISSPLQELISNLVRLVQHHPRCAHQLFNLAVADEPTTNIPPLSLFDPARGWSGDLLLVDVSRIRRAILTNAFSTKDGIYGLWALPSFLNHGCDPNCTVRYEGDVQVIQAYSEIASGQELVTTYFDIDRTYFYRQKRARKWGFTCSCPRCIFEEKLCDSMPLFMNLSKRLHDMYEASLPELDSEGLVPKASNHSAALSNEVENMLQLDQRCATMTPQQKRWIRTSFSRSARAYSTSCYSRKSSVRCRYDSQALGGEKVRGNQASIFCWLLPRSRPLLRPQLRLWRFPAVLA